MAHAARLNRTALQSHIPRKFWSQLPEARVTEPLAAAAASRGWKMFAAEAAVPRRGHKTPLRSVGEAAVPNTLNECRRCPLWMRRKTFPAKDRRGQG